MTVTPPIVDDDTTFVEAHEFDIPCDLLRPFHCGQAAEWLLIIKLHECWPPGNIERFVCAQHWEELPDVVIRCVRCGHFARISEYIVRTERLKP